MSLTKIRAIIYKQMIDTKRNVIILFLILLYPILTFIFYALLSGNPVVNMIIPSFITLNIVMIPIIIMSNIISEEKEKDTLRILVMSNVAPIEYFIGVGTTLFIVIMFSLIPYTFLLKLTLVSTVYYFIYSSLGVVISLIIGAIIGIIIKNQMGVGAISSPVSMFFGMLPMLTNINNKIKSFSFILYSQKIYDLIVNVEEHSLSNILVIVINLILLGGIFIMLYIRKGIE